MSSLIYVLIGIAGGAVAVALIDRVRACSLLNKARGELAKAEKAIEEKRKEFELEKKEQLHQLKVKFERETEERRKEFRELSAKLIEREEALDRYSHELERERKKLFLKEQEIEEEKRKLKELEAKQREELERIGGMSAEEAKRSLLEKVEKETKEEALQIVQEIEKEARETANKKARKIIATAIQRCSVDQISESVVSTVPLPNDEMKGRIIGREGRNIRTFEALTGVDLIVDDTPGTVVISCFDPLRRKIAEISLERLIADTRIHPARIEEVVEKARRDVEEIIQEEGQRAAFDMGISNFSPELIKLLGKLKFRTSYGQNVLQHSKEVAYIAGIIAAEIGENSSWAKRAGLLHDIGKAVDQEIEGPHALIGAHLAKQYGEHPEVVHAIAAHHEDKIADTPLALIVQAADAISAARPGARKEVLEAYIKRLEDLESIATAFSGVDKAYAIQAGREVRIMVQPQEVSDEIAVKLSRKIAEKIKKELSYPGQIKVTVIREFRSVEYAK
ncbi:ribonuclease Y [Candidatus Aerophobetes bacterium]|uniref:Ribonuclease Y n=1 Tax=Aerophobetes bacterium TaxID=2030807 RepID=A0A497E216_UNCAE|nr:MAG: ribonuclease Y [Candidatus Aerophobetes bacterium]